MHGQGLQPVRSEVEAIVTFQSALNRLALQVDEDALTEWTGPRPDDVDALAGDDDTFSFEELHEVRKQAAQALAKRFREVLESVKSHAELRALLARALLAATGGVVHLDGPSPEAVLTALSRTGAIRLDWAQSAAILVREELSRLEVPAAKPRRAPKKKAAAKKKPAPKPKAKTKTKAKAKPTKPAKKAGTKTKAKKPKKPKKSA